MLTFRKMDWPITGNPARRRVLVGIAGTLALTATGCDIVDTRRIWIGDVFPEFSLPTPEGQAIAIGNYGNRGLIINFWATWCPPCRREMADLETLHKHLDKSRFTLLAISVDNDVNLVKEFLLKEKLTFPVLVDLTGTWSNAQLKVPGFPTTYLVGSDGIVKDAMVGPRAWAEKSFQAEILTRLGSPR